MKNVAVVLAAVMGAGLMLDGFAGGLDIGETLIESEVTTINEYYPLEESSPSSEYVNLLDYLEEDVSETPHTPYFPI